MRRRATPKILTEEEQTWSAIDRLREFEDEHVRLFWYSEVPGSGAPERLMVGAVQAAANRGRDVRRAESLLMEGLEAYERDDIPTLHRLTSQIFHELERAPRDETSPYWRFKRMSGWNDHEAAVQFPEPATVDVFSEDFAQRVEAGWLGQIAGGALGTALEGYTTEQIRRTLGEVRGYVREPNTFNDDITYELAFLKAFASKGYSVDSADIAAQWVALIPFGWSAEHVALQNLKLGIYPPESGRRSNPFAEWIGAQMRGAVCGLVAPGDPRKAARLAWIDGVISHEANGVLGETFNAVLTSLAFIEEDMHRLVRRAVQLIPEGTEYHWVVAS